MPADETPASSGSRRRDEGEVPIFRTWPRIHAAVIVVAIAVMALLALFSRWPF
jgi:hypothetical protein